MATKKRTQHAPAFKFKVVLEAIRKDNATAVARSHNIDWSLLNKWKRFFLVHGMNVFAGTPDTEKAAYEKKIEKLEQIVGRKEVELSLLKNFADFYGSRSTA
jgi:transposase-like protein